VAFGDGVAALEAVFAATHTGDFASIPATGASVRVPYCVVYELVDEKITALHAYFPIMALAQQLRPGSP
jgi:predicted ester cyclase